MFTRWGDTRNVRSLAEPQLVEQPHAMARQAAPAVITMPPPMPGEPQRAAAPSAGAPFAAAPIPSPTTVQPLSVTPESEQGAAAHSVIGQDLTIEGQSITIRCRGALEVNGKIQAELHSQKLVVGPSGVVEGTIAADSVDVWGRVSGTILGSRVMLHPSAAVEGDIHAKSLSVADGASFEGRSRKVSDPATIAPRLEPEAPPVRPAGAAPIQLPLTTPLPTSSS